MYKFDDELKIDSQYDRNTNYRAKLDALLPKWEPSGRFIDMERSKLLNGGPTGCQVIETGGPTEYHYPDGRMVHLPSQRSARALDKNGWLHYVTTSTCRPGPESPMGEDNLGTAWRVRAEKQESHGWLFLEPEDGFGNLKGEPYLAWVFETQKVRVAAYEQEQKLQAESFKSENVRALEENARQTGQVTADALRAVAGMNSEAIQQLAAVLAEALSKKGSK